MCSEHKHQTLPASVNDLKGAPEVASFLADSFLAREPAALLRYGDTTGRILNQRSLGGPVDGYLRKFLGATVTETQRDWMAEQIEKSIAIADVIGLRSDLLGPKLPKDFFDTRNAKTLQRLSSLYPIRPFERKTLQEGGARRLAETRRAMESMRLPETAILTNAWIHLGLASIGFTSALLRDAPSVAVCTSSTSRLVLEKLAVVLGSRLRFFECPGYPDEERKWGADHEFLWHRWKAVVASAVPSYRGEPLFISAGIWTKVLAPTWADRGGIAIDMGSVMDFWGERPTRPAVLATEFGDAQNVPNFMLAEQQFAREEHVQDYVLRS